MKSSKLIVKLYAEGESNLKAHDVVPVFHSWIQTRALPDHLLIDVSDYGHVNDGPGALLVSAEANISVDRFDGRLGLSYQRKLPLPGELHDRLRYCVRAAMEAAALLEEYLAGQVKFATDELTVRVNDRLEGPNTPQTFEQVRADLEPLLGEAFPGGAFQFEHPSTDPRQLFAVHARVVDVGLAGPASDVRSLLSRLESTATPTNQSATA